MHFFYPAFFPSLFFHSLSFFLSFSDMKGERGVWREQTASSPTVLPAWCRPQWGPVNATVLRAWRRGPDVPHTVALLSPTGRPCSTATLSTRLGTLRTATGAQERPPLCSHGTENHFSVCSKTPLRFSAQSPLPPGTGMGGVKDSIANIHSTYHYREGWGAPTLLIKTWTPKTV